MSTRAVALALVLFVLALAPPYARADENPPDRYLCYLAGTTKNKRLPSISGDLVALHDRLGAPQTFKLRRLASLCNPAGVNGSAVSHATVHLEGLTIKKLKTAPKFVPSTRVVTDEFGTRTVVLQIPTAYFDVTPAIPGTTAPPYFADDPTTSATEINRFKCYAAVAPKDAAKFVPPPSPIVKDEVFPNGQVFTMKKPTQICFAAAADGAPDDGAARPKALACYGVKLPSGVKFPRQTVGTHGRTVGGRVVGRRKPSELCVPATVS